MDIKYSLLFLCFILSHAEAERCNVAAGKPATMSSILANPLHGSPGAERAVDDYRPYSYALTRASSDPSSPSWLSVDLRSRYFIEEVMVHYHNPRNRTVFFDPYTLNIIMLNSLERDGESLKPRPDNICGVIREQHEKRPKEYVICNKIPNTFQHVVVVASYPYQLMIYDFHVIAEKVNVAFKRPAIQSTTNHEKIAALAVDGNSYTYSETEYFNEELSGHSKLPTWLSVDLGHLYHVETVYARYYTDPGLVSQYGEHMTISLSNHFNPTNSTKLGVCAKVTMAEMENTFTLSCSNDEGEYRFVSLVIWHKMFQISVWDFEVYASKRNIALGRQAFQSSTVGEHEAIFAVDGNEDTFSMTTSHMDIFLGCFLLVDLDQEYYIESVNVTFQSTAEEKAKFAGVLQIYMASIRTLGIQDHTVCSTINIIGKDILQNEYVLCDKVPEAFHQIHLVLPSKHTLKVHEIQVYQAVPPIDQEGATPAATAKPEYIDVSGSAATKLHAFCGKLVCFVILCYYAGFSASP